MAKAFLTLRKVKAKTQQVILLGFKFGDSQILYSTGIKIVPSQWDVKKKEIKRVALPDVSFIKEIQEFSGSIPTSDELNHFLRLLKSVANNHEQENKESFTKESLKAVLNKVYEKKDELQNLATDINKFIQTTINDAKKTKRYLTKEQLIQKIESFLKPTTEVQLFDYIEQFIHEAETGYRLIDGVKRYAVRSIQRYRSTQKLLQDFQNEYSRKLDFDTIDLTFYKDFSSYMATAKDYAPETMGKHITALKTFLREATEEGINQNLTYQKKTFKVASKDGEESVNIALNETELSEMYQLDLSANQRLERVRDLFIIGANTGLRFSDFTDIKPQNIKEDKEGAFIDTIQFKTKRRLVVPINETVKAILQKYNNVLPEAVSNQKFNEYIKEVAQLCESLQSMEFLAYVKGGKNIQENLERWKMISSHTARRSFATNAYERGTPVLSIMAITDHKTEKAFMAYIKTSKRKQAEIFRGYQK
jgi:site-specific recombinase XerD